MSNKDKYSMMESVEYCDGILVSKHERYNELVADMLWAKLGVSKYTKGELSERLGWDLHKLMLVMSADKTINMFDMVHIAGALGFKWEFNLVEVDSDSYE